MPDLLKVGLSGRARFKDMPSDVLPSAADAPGSKLAANEIVVAHFPVGTYRLITDMTGVRLVRCDLSSTADAGPPSVAAIQAANERFWGRRSGR